MGAHADTRIISQTASTTQLTEGVGGPHPYAAQTFTLGSTNSIQSISIAETYGGGLLVVDSGHNTVCSPVSQSGVPVTGGTRYSFIPACTLSAGTYTLIQGVNNPLYQIAVDDADVYAGGQAGNSDLDGNNFAAAGIGDDDWVFTVCSDLTCNLTGSGGIPAGTPSYIIATTPANGATIATSSTATIGAETFVNSQDFLNSGLSGWTVRITLQRSALSFSTYTSPFNSTPTNTTIEFTVTAGTTDDYVFSTTTPITAEGLYTMTTQIRHSSTIGSISSFFGLTSFFDPDLVAATTTTFTASTSTPIDIFESQLRLAMGGFGFLASTTLTASSCSITSLADCVTWLFTPLPDTLLAYSNIGNELSTKPPFGYFGALRALIASSTSATSSPAFALVGASFLSGTLAPLETGLEWILYFALGWWLIHRIRRYRLQS